MKQERRKNAFKLETDSFLSDSMQVKLFPPVVRT